MWKLADKVYSSERLCHPSVAMAVSDWGRLIPLR